MMKKLFFASLALSLGLSITSCKQNATPPVNNETPATAQEPSAEAQQPSDEMPTSLGELFEKAKADGASWSEEQWKAAAANCMKAALPAAKAVEEMTKAVEKNPAEGVAMMEKIKKEHPEYEEILKQLDDFGKMATTFENGKKVFENEEIINKLMDEIGFPKDL